MNALFGGASKCFLALLKTQNTLRQDHGDRANWACLGRPSKRRLGRYHGVLMYRLEHHED